MRTGFTAGFTARAAAAVMAGAAAVAVAGLAVPAGAAPRAAAKTTGTEHIQIMSTSATSTKASVIVWGAFTAAGVDNMGNSVDRVVLPGGSFKVKHSNGTGPQSFNPKTCLFQAHIHGTYTIVSGSGSGKYKGITGHGTYTASIIGLGVKTKSGACSQTAAPVAQQQIVDASGPVTLP